MKTFLEVFPDLHIAENVRGLLEMVGIEKISTNRDRSVIRVYIDSPRLMHKQSIYDLEKGIKEQLFPGKRVTIKILEKYHLSSQYTPEKLMNVYRDSILMELKNYSILLYNMFRKAEMDFEEEGYLKLSLEDTMIVRDKAQELVRILEKIFTERCNVPMVVKTSYRPVEKKNTEPEIIYMKPQAAGESGAAGGNGTAAGAAGANEAYMEPSGAEPASGGVDLPFDEGKTVLKPVGKLKAGGNPAGGRNQAGSANAGSGKGGEYRRSGYMKKSDNPDVLFGRDFDEEASPIEELEGEVGQVVIRGKILTCELRELRSGNTLFLFSVTDFTDTIGVKIFAREDTLDDLKTATKVGQFVRIKGVANIDKFDGELTIGSVSGIKKCEDFTSKRMDNSPVKRVELHCHTKMSDMDGVSEVKDIIKRAKQWGMDAIAVTDHGCVQAFPDANHAVDKGENFKILYGVEGYLVDDMKELAENEKGQTLDHTCVVFDIETTGFSPIKNHIIEIGAVRVTDGKIVDKFSTFVNPEVPIPYDIEQLTSINDGMVISAPTIEEVLPEFLAFCEGAVMVAHNASFDISFIKENAKTAGTHIPADGSRYGFAGACSAAEPEPLQARHGSERA